MVKKIVSGGQMGADRGALEAATELNIETGGWCPKGWKTEAGTDLSLKAFGLQETESPDYVVRTFRNVAESDGTVIFGNTRTGGSGLTIALCERTDKPYLLNPEAGELREWIAENAITVLNVAGNRESRTPGIKEATRRYLLEELREP